MDPDSAVNCHYSFQPRSEPLHQLLKLIDRPVLCHRCRQLPVPPDQLAVPPDWPYCRHKSACSIRDVFYFRMVVNDVVNEVGANKTAATRYDNVLIFRHACVS